MSKSQPGRNFSLIRGNRASIAPWIWLVKSSSVYWILRSAPAAPEPDQHPVDVDGVDHHQVPSIPGCAHSSQPRVVVAGVVPRALAGVVPHAGWIEASWGRETEQKSSAQTLRNG